MEFLAAVTLKGACRIPIQGYAVRAHAMGEKDFRVKTGTFNSLVLEFTHCPLEGVRYGGAWIIHHECPYCMKSIVTS
jgi:hypothetical protein